MAYKWLPAFSSAAQGIGCLLSVRSQRHKPGCEGRDGRPDRAEGGDGDGLLVAYVTGVSLPVTRPVGLIMYERPVDVVVSPLVTVCSFCELIEDNHHRLY